MIHLDVFIVHTWWVLALTLLDLHCVCAYICANRRGSSLSGDSCATTAVNSAAVLPVFGFYWWTGCRCCAGI